VTIPHEAPISGASYSAAELLLGDDVAILLDQRLLPEREIYLEIKTTAEMARAISEMAVRGAPAIGVAAAYGMVLAAREKTRDFLKTMTDAGALLERQRPTAVNLAWAVQACLGEARRIEAQPHAARVSALAAFARRLHADDVRANRKLGLLGAECLPKDAVLLTHCNAGALATGGYGTALGVVRALAERGGRVRVLADETRPRLQGARLTAWELARDGIAVEVIVDGSAASFMAREEVAAVIVGADRIARNGDVANKIGTYGLACVAAHHAVPFMVAAPWSTVDLACESGAAIPIEARSELEVTEVEGIRLCPPGVRARNPAFDVTPAALVRFLVTERGVARPPLGAALENLA
jgi:methylthioribose-1-phosphate isomerase